MANDDNVIGFPKEKISFLDQVREQMQPPMEQILLIAIGLAGKHYRHLIDDKASPETISIILASLLTNEMAHSLRRKAIAILKSEDEYEKLQQLMYRDMPTK
ncbi:MAG: hypothetical protein JWO50_652 [Candidatus Kaiserbacteria bacterium]|nr:hypothetical protein [Candidatus Kaiserbacteria bacterium]